MPVAAFRLALPHLRAAPALRASTRAAMVAAHVSGPSSVRAASSSAAASESNEPPVQLLSDGTMRVLQLNRPRVLNAINEEMIDIVRESLDRIEA